MNRPDKAESRRIRLEIRRVFLEVWDPIGVNGAPFAQDEYDGYIGEMYELLLKSATDSELEAYLMWAAHDRMGFSESTCKAKHPAVMLALRKTPFPQ